MPFAHGAGGGGRLPIPCCRQRNLALTRPTPLRQHGFYVRCRRARQNERRPWRAAVSEFPPEDVAVRQVVVVGEAGERGAPLWAA